MENVKNLKTINETNKGVISDFFKIPNLKFDINKLRLDLDKILAKKTLIL